MRKYCHSFFYIVMVFSCPQCVFAELGTIIGVVATQDGSLSGANVELFDRDKVNVLGTTSDLRGRFTIENIPPGTYNLRVTFIGYRDNRIDDVVVTEGKETVLKITMIESPLVGQEVVVSASRRPERVVAHIPTPLDGRDDHIVNRSTNLTELIAKSMRSVIPKSDLVIFNSGTLRIDDTVPPGPVTEYDVIRIIPFGDTVVSLEIKGHLLQRILNQGRANRGSGGFLQTANVRFDKGIWFVGDKRLGQDQSYRVAMNDFLLTGREKGLGFLTRENPDLRVISEHGDIRRALIAQLKRAFHGE